MPETTPRLVIRAPDGDETIVVLRQGTHVLGQGADADVRIPVADVAARHAELTWDGSHLLLRDLRSGHGTTVNGRVVMDWIDLREGDTIRLGLAEAHIEALHGIAALTPTATATAPQPQTGRRRQIFISHASEDKRSARALARMLERQGWDPWIDESDIKGGSAWAASIQTAIKQSAAMVLLVTANSVAKDWVLDEVTAARNLRVPVIPAILEPARYPPDMQFLLQRTQSVDITGMEVTKLARLDSAILDVLERQGATNPDRVKLRIGQLLGAIGIVAVLSGFVGFILAGFSQVAEGEVGPDFQTVLIPFFVFMAGGIVAGIGSAMVRSARARGI